MFTLFLSLLWLSAALAVPVHIDYPHSLTLVPRLNLCNIYVLSAFVCQNNEVQLITTPMGLARGVQTTPDAVKFSVKYATAPRFRPPSLATSWTLPFAVPLLFSALS